MRVKYVSVLYLLHALVVVFGLAHGVRAKINEQIEARVYAEEHVLGLELREQRQMLGLNLQVTLMSKIKQM